MPREAPMLQAPFEELVTSTSDVSALLAILPADSASPANKRMKRELKDVKEVKGDIELNAPSHSYQSSSNASSPIREDDDSKNTNESFRVDDVDMWEVLEALEVPSPRLRPTESNDPFLSGLGQSPHSPVPAHGSTLAAASTAPPAKSTGLSPGTGDDFRLEALQPVPAPGFSMKRPAPGDDAACPEPPVPTALGPMAVDFPAVDMQAEEACDANMDPTEEKRLKRMRRNRESAAMSRNRKKAYIEELESKVKSLGSSLSLLQSENWALKQENTALRAQLGVPADAAAASAAAASAAPTAAPEEVAASAAVVGVEGTAAASVATSAAAAAAVGAVSSGEMTEGGSQGKKLGSTLSTTGIALMSALTFVTFTVSSTMSGAFGAAGGAHMGRSPVARALMSIRDDPLVRSADEVPLWPSLSLLKGVREHADDYHAPVALPMHALAPSSHSYKMEDLPPAALPNSERVVRLPPNSSWADALRTEAADVRLKELQVHPGLHGRATYAQEEHTVYEPQWEEEAEPAEPEDLFVDDSSFDSFSEAQRRFIFCARAYTFDMTRAAASEPQPASTSTELQLPAAMPARFRHTAMRSGAVPQLTSGNTSGDEDAAGMHPKLPIVSLLMPSAALRGVVQTERLDPWTPSSHVDDSLVQVSCQVLNATRFT